MFRQHSPQPYRELMPEQRIVTNRVFVLGLDELYREAMKCHERTELLQCAEEVASVLSLAPGNVPVEGYYTESPELTRYFQLVRTLQNVPQEREAEVSDVKSFQRLKQVTGSLIFGTPADQRYLLPTGKDALSIAMKQTFPAWTIANLTAETFHIAIDSDDYSLVAIAALSKDPVVLAACRESVVLYAFAVAGSAHISEEPEYLWQVDPLIEQRATKFVRTFNQLFNESLPEPTSKHAREYFVACCEWKLVGRCVHIGFDDSSKPVRHYHWAIKRGTDYQLTVEEFWDNELWTTQRYSKKLRAD
ncbi:hypothetical protein [Acaryochloris sp. CCMEE 5410]|uniref:hypothetical protein n=1 Tax=Acaryochloris sp. CCMEE 5410 TaxID=310037 RepID=UPI0002484990|nr:hypothetical protein [Acaryochloris sp. CCMEE 5410]